MPPVLGRALWGSSCSTAFSCSFSLGQHSPGERCPWAQNDRITPFYQELQIPAALSSRGSFLTRAEPPALLGLDPRTFSTSQNPGGIPEPGIVLLTWELGWWDRGQGCPQGKGSLLSPRRDLGDFLGSQPTPGMNSSVDPNPLPFIPRAFGNLTPNQHSEKDLDLFIYFPKKTPNGLFLFKANTIYVTAPAEPSHPQLQPQLINYSPYYIQCQEENPRAPSLHI